MTTAPETFELASDSDAVVIGSDALLSVHLAPGGIAETVEWPTPQWLFDALNKEFGFTLDPCSTHENAKCKKHFTREENGLMKPWGRETVWMNPPYGREIGAWMGKAFGAAEEGATVVALIPARTDTDWWHSYAMKHEIRFLRGRLKFEGAEQFAPFPSALVVMRPATFRLGAFSSDNDEMRDAKGETKL